MLFLLLLPVTYLSFFLKFKSSRVNFPPVPLNFRRGNRREHFFFDHSDFSWMDAEDSNILSENMMHETVSADHTVAFETHYVWFGLG